MAIKFGIDLKNLPKGVRIAIAVVPAVLFAGIFGYMAIYPKSGVINALKQDISKQESDIQQSQSMAAKLDVLKEENRKLKDRLQELSKQLPEEKEISVLLTHISNLGIKSGLTILSWSPSRDRRLHSSGIVYEVPVSINLTGNYHSLGKFFSSLTGLDRIVNILNIGLSGPRVVGNEMVLSITFSAVTFTSATEGGIAGGGQ